MESFTRTQTDTLAEMVAPDRFSTGQSNRALHIKDISPHQGKLPAGVIWPVTTEEYPLFLPIPMPLVFPSPPGGRVPAPKATPFRSLAAW